MLFQQLKAKEKKGTMNERPHTNGTESSAEITIDDIQIAKPMDVPYTRAEYDFFRVQLHKNCSYDLDIIVSQVQE
jgi:hypothetical protein